MSADAAPLTKVDSAVQGLSSSPDAAKQAAAAKRRASSAVSGVYHIQDLGMSDLPDHVAKRKLTCTVRG